MSRGNALDSVVGAYIVNDFGRVLLIKHRRLNKWLPVGGHIEEDKNETPDDATRREIREEVGLEVTFMHYPEPRKCNMREYALPFYVNVHPIDTGGTHRHYCLYYACEPKKGGKMKINRKEIKAAKWCHRGNLNFMNPPMSEEEIKMCEDAMRLARAYYEARR